ncbi:MAG: hypothetical protein JWR18_4314, partial [Segetibacter sp.]|nr:hypothetical protein [Segetibacter sp.]
ATVEPCVQNIEVVRSQIQSWENAAAATRLSCNRARENTFLSVIPIAQVDANVCCV